MTDKKNFDLDKPQYNSTLKLIKKLDDMEKNNKAQIHLSDDELERIHEKVFFKN